MAVRIELDPSDVLEYAFVKENSHVDQRRCQVTVCDADSQQITLEFHNRSKEVMKYNNLSNILNSQEEDGDQIWNLKGIKGH